MAISLLQCSPMSRSGSSSLRKPLLVMAGSLLCMGLRCPRDTPRDVAGDHDTPTNPIARDSMARDPRPLLAPGRTWIEMRNVNLRVDDYAVLRVRRLHGEVLSTTGGPAFLDDTKSFSIRIVSATVALTGPDLTTLLNKFVFGYPGSPLKRLEVRTKGEHIVQTGVMHKGVDLPFEMTASVGVLPDGRVRMHPIKTDMLGIDGMKFLRAIGLKLEQLLDLSKASGAEMHGDDIYLDATKITPPPRIMGKLVSIRVVGDELVQEFETLPDDSLFATTIRPDSTIPNFIYFRGGQVKFGKLLMADADLLIADQNPNDPFDLYLARYTEQLVRGTSRTLENLGLVAVLPDYAGMVR